MQVRTMRARFGFFFLAILVLSACARSQTSTAGLTPSPTALDGAAILQRACTVCHSLGGLSAYAASWGEPEWRSMVETMIAYGAVLTPAEVDALSGYLAVNYGTGGRADENGIAALVDSACASCHGLDILTTNTSGYTAGDFRETVVRMIQYGAPVPEDLVDPMVAYLVETYGPGD